MLLKIVTHGCGLSANDAKGASFRTFCVPVAIARFSTCAKKCRKILEMLLSSKRNSKMFPGKQAPASGLYRRRFIKNVDSLVQPPFLMLVIFSQANNFLHFLRSLRTLASHPLCATISSSAASPDRWRFPRTEVIVQMAWIKILNSALSEMDRKR